MIHTMTRGKVQNMPTPDLEQTAVQSPGALMPTTSRQQRSLKGSKERQPKKRFHTCLKHESERGQESSTRPRQSPPTVELQNQVNQDGRIQQKDCAQHQVKRKEKTGIRIQQKDEISHNSKAWELQPACNAREREASRIRRAVAPDRRANDIAKQVTTTREEVIRTREGK